MQIDMHFSCLPMLFITYFIKSPMVSIYSSLRGKPERPYESLPTADVTIDDTGALL